MKADHDRSRLGKVLLSLAMLALAGVPTTAHAEARLVRLSPAAASSASWKADLISRLGNHFEIEELATTLGSPEGCQPKVEPGARPRVCLRVINDTCAARDGARAWVLLQDDSAAQPDLTSVVADLITDGVLDYQQLPAGPWHTPGRSQEPSEQQICQFHWPIPDVPRPGAITNLCSRTEIEVARDNDPRNGPDPLHARACHVKAARDAGEGVLVGVLDTGVATDHPDLVGSISTRTQRDVLNGGTNDGYDYIPDPNHPDEKQRGINRGHGTLIAGVIAASQDGQAVQQGQGIRGIAPLAKILPVRMLDKNVSGDVIHAREAVCHAIDQGVDIINASWAFCGPAPDEEKFLREAIELAQQENILVVAAASPTGFKMKHSGFPAVYDLPNVISVAASLGGYSTNLGMCVTDEPSRLKLVGNPNAAGFQYCHTEPGRPCDVAAPGGGVFSTTYPVPQECRLHSHERLHRSGTRLAAWVGSSFATPYVAGAAAAYLARCRASDAPREPTASEVREAIFKASAQPPGTAAEFPNMHGYLDLAVLQRCTCPGAPGGISCAP